MDLSSINWWYVGGALVVLAYLGLNYGPDAVRRVGWWFGSQRKPADQKPDSDVVPGPATRDYIAALDKQLGKAPAQFKLDCMLAGLTVSEAKSKLIEQIQGQEASKQ